MKAPKQRFRILKFINPRTGTTSWRVTGIKRNGERIRENYADPQEAQYRYTELEGEFHAANGVAALRATRLTDEQIGIAEAAFKRLERDEDMITAVDHWHRTGKPAAISARGCRRSANRRPESVPDLIPLLAPERGWGSLIP